MADTPIYKKLVFLETHPKEQIDKKDWCELEEMIGGFVYGFAVLKQKLSLKEYRICILIKLGFSPSTISHFIGTSLSDISLSRQRMFTKVCGKVGRAKDFDEYIRHIL